MLNKVKEYLKKYKNINIAGIEKSATAFLISQLFPVLKKNMLVITENFRKAHILYNDIKFFLNQPAELYYFPEYKSLPYNADSYSLTEMTRKIEFLYRLIFSNRYSLFVIPLKNILTRILPVKVLRENIFELKINDVIDFEKFKHLLVQFNYVREDKVFTPGSFSIRGNIIDIYIPVYKSPIRIELFDEIIESMRFFSIETQRSVTSIERIFLTPATELILKDKYITQFQMELKKMIKHQEKVFESPEKLWSTKFTDFTGISPDIENKPGDYYCLLPFFYKKLDTIFNYLNRDTIIFLADEEEILKERANTIYNEYRLHYESRLKNNKAGIPVEEFILRPAEFFENLTKFNTITANLLPVEHKTHLYFRFDSIPMYKGNFNSLKADISEHLKLGIEYTFISENSESLNDLRKKVLGNISSAKIQFRTGKIEKGFISFDFKKAFIQDIEFYGKIRFEEKETEPLIFSTLEDISELKEGDYVVHIENGIGIYRGLKHIESGELKGDFIEIEYANGAKLYLPAAKMNLIHKYIGDRETPPVLNKLGSNSFKRTKTYVERSVVSIAKDLIKIYALRQKHSGFKFPPDTEWQKEFEDSFPYIETPDQIRAMNEIKQDMESARPMDRLICGDVGYGKTELAVRAAFKAVMAGKQVAVLVPTTILAYQHYNTFAERLKDYPVRVEMLSRFNSAGEQKKILKDIAGGKIDIIIGTHRLIQPDVKFHDLGLLIIDEEHRFGVTHKEKLKMARATVDVITMSATPIPRTLYMSISGIRDISMITTPPPGRMPVETKIVRFSPEIIRYAILYELNRGGQVFFLHNRVQSIKPMAEYIKRIVPEARICVIHGQMDEDEMELTMLEFLEKNYDVLVCTTIIESGIDIPSVNTIIINRADTFGLAQLYQLRGRVGRSDIKSYAYLLVPSDKALTETAQKRLLTIFEYTDLGSGYKIAMKDLEIRGAGNIFGVQQHGNILAVGLEMYCKILNKVIKNLKGELAEEEIEPELDSGYSSYIPDNFVESNALKIEIYKKLNKCRNNKELLELIDEIKDRFGEKIPGVMQNLFLLQEIKFVARRNKILRIKKIETKQYEIVIEILFKQIDRQIARKLKTELKNCSISQNRLYVSVNKKNFLKNLKNLLQSIF